MRFKSALLAWCFVTCAATLAPAATNSPVGAPPSGVSKTILNGISSATPTESFLLAPELNFLHPDKQRIHSWPVVARGRDLDSAQVASLSLLLGKATRNRPPGGPDHCGFSPSYGLRFHGSGDPLDMLISSDYARWCFLCGDTNEGGYSPETTAVRDSLGVFIHRLFPNLERPDEGSRP